MDKNEIVLIPARKPYSPEMEAWFVGKADTVGGEKIQTGQVISVHTHDGYQDVVEVGHVYRDEQWTWRDGHITADLSATVTSLTTGESRPLYYADFFHAKVLASDVESYRQQQSYGYGM